MEESNAEITQTAASGTVEDAWISLARNGAVGLRHNQTLVAETASTGFQLQAIAGSNTILQVEANAGQDAIYRAFNDIGGVRLEVLDTSGLVRIGQSNASGVFEESWMEFTRNGGTSVFANGILRLTAGLTISAFEAVTGQDTNVEIRGPAGQDSRLRNYSNAGGVSIEAITGTGLVNFRQLSSEARQKTSGFSALATQTSHYVTTTSRLRVQQHSRMAASRLIKTTLRDSIRFTLEALARISRERLRTATRIAPARQP